MAEVETEVEEEEKAEEVEVEVEVEVEGEEVEKGVHSMRIDGVSQEEPRQSTI